MPRRKQNSGEQPQNGSGGKPKRRRPRPAPQPIRPDWLYPLNQGLASAGTSRTWQKKVDQDPNAFLIGPLKILTIGQRHWVEGSELIRWMKEVAFWSEVLVFNYKKKNRPPGED